MKRCTKCSEYKPLEQFAKNSWRTDGLQSQCRSCKKTTDAAYYSGHKHSQRIRNRANRKKLREWVNSYKSTGCLCCGEKEPCCLDFHHVADKVKDISSMVSRCSKSEILNEINKCQEITRRQTEFGLF